VCACAGGCLTPHPCALNYAEFRTSVSFLKPRLYNNWEQLSRIVGAMHNRIHVVPSCCININR
jgi:hypothetical protein